MNKGKHTLMRRAILLVILIGLVIVFALSRSNATKSIFIEQWLQEYRQEHIQTNNVEDQFYLKLSEAAIERTRHKIRYVADYVVIDYPMGDVPESTGVCTDVVIRSFRSVGIDLQVDVHEDMKGHFNEYPDIWRLTGPDANIDHRRVPNLMTYFKRKGTTLPISRKNAAYLPGDIVAWDLGSGLTHIGIVVNRKNKQGNRYMVVHNIGAGPRMEDVLFAWDIIGHFRYPRLSMS